MKLYNQWRFGEFWGISLFTVFGSNDFFGIVLFGIMFEFARTPVGNRIHELS